MVILVARKSSSSTSLSLFKSSSQQQQQQKRSSSSNHCSHCLGFQSHCTCTYGCTKSSRSQCICVHDDNTCTSCGVNPILGPLYVCGRCDDDGDMESQVSLCQTCFNEQRHDMTHPFIQHFYPLRFHRPAIPIPASMNKKLTTTTTTKRIQHHSLPSCSKCFHPRSATHCCTFDYTWLCTVCYVLGMHSLQTPHSFIVRTNRNQQGQWLVHRQAWPQPFLDVGRPNECEDEIDEDEGHCVHCAGWAAPCVCEYSCPKSRLSRCVQVHDETCSKCGTHPIPQVFYFCGRCIINNNNHSKNNKQVVLCHTCYNNHNNQHSNHDDNDDDDQCLYHPFIMRSFQNNTTTVTTTRLPPRRRNFKSDAYFVNNQHDNISFNYPSIAIHKTRCVVCEIYPIKGILFTCTLTHSSLCSQCYVTGMYHVDTPFTASICTMLQSHYVQHLPPRSTTTTNEQQQQFPIILPKYPHCIHCPGLPSPCACPHSSSSSSLCATSMKFQSVHSNFQQPQPPLPPPQCYKLFPNSPICASCSKPLINVMYICSGCNSMKFCTDCHKTHGIHDIKSGTIHACVMVNIATEQVSAFTSGPNKKALFISPECTNGLQNRGFICSGCGRKDFKGDVFLKPQSQNGEGEEVLCVWCYAVGMKNVHDTYIKISSFEQIPVHGLAPPPMKLVPRSLSSSSSSEEENRRRKRIETHNEGVERIANGEDEAIKEEKEKEKENESEHKHEQAHVFEKHEEEIRLMGNMKIISDDPYKVATGTTNIVS